MCDTNRFWLLRCNYDRSQLVSRNGWTEFGIKDKNDENDKIGHFLIDHYKTVSNPKILFAVQIIILLCVILPIIVCVRLFVSELVELGIIFCFSVFQFMLIFYFSRRIQDIDDSFLMRYAYVITHFRRHSAPSNCGATTSCVSRGFVVQYRHVR